MQEVKEDILRLWEEKQLRITDEIQTAPEVLYANGSVIGTLGNFSASTGKAKSKKTFNVAAIVGASLVNGKGIACTGGIENLHDITFAPGNRSTAVIDSFRFHHRALENKGFGIRPVVFNRPDFTTAG